MGWNDHMSIAETQCLTCGVVDDWEYWDATGVARYSGKMGEMLGVDPSKSGKCPHCGSTKGEALEERSPTLDDMLAHFGIKR
jgi:hypothetical protein